MSSWKIGRIFLCLGLITAGFIAGWVARVQWLQKVDETRSNLALIEAHNLYIKGCIDKAIEYSAYSLALNRNSQVADVQLRDFLNKYAEISKDGDIKQCKQ